MIAMAIALCLLALALTWPLLAAQSIARSNDFSRHDQLVIAWVVEAVYVATLLLVGASVALETWKPGLLGVGLLGIAFLVVALLQGDDEAGAACTSTFAATVQEARHVATRVHNRLPLPLSASLSDDVTKVFDKFSREQQGYEPDHPFYKAIVRFEDGMSYRGDESPKMDALLTACGVSH